MANAVMTYPAHGRAVLRLGLPLIGGHMGQIAIGVTDSVMLGWYGIEELAAVTLAGSAYFLLFLLGAGFAWAVMPMVATFAAEQDERSIRRATRMGLWLSLLYAVCVMPLMLWSLPILQLLGQGETTSVLSAEYLRVASWGIFPALVVMTLKSYLAALERTQIVLWMTIAAALANGIANYALIYGNWGFPELGITGAALASIITQLVMLAAVVIYALRVLPEHALFKRFWRADWEMFRRVARLGIPIGLTTLSEVGMFNASAIMMGWLGTVPLAAHGIAMNITSVMFMAHLGLANVATIRVGNALGRQDRLHLIRGGHTVICLSVLFSAATIALFLSVPEALVSLFMQPQEPDRLEILRIGVVLLALAALFQLVDGLQVVGLGLLRGVQDTGVPMLLAAISYWGVGMPAGYVLGFVFGWDGAGIWLGMSLGLGTAAALLNARFWGWSVREVGKSLSGDGRCSDP